MKDFDLQKALENAELIINDEKYGIVTRIKSISYHPEAEDGYRLCAYYENGSAGFYYDNGEWNTGASCGGDLKIQNIQKEGWINIYRTKSENENISGRFIYKNEGEAKYAASIDKNYITTIKITWEE